MVQVSSLLVLLCGIISTHVCSAACAIGSDQTANVDAAYMCGPLGVTPNPTEYTINDDALSNNLVCEQEDGSGVSVTVDCTGVGSGLISCFNFASAGKTSGACGSCDTSLTDGDEVAFLASSDGEACIGQATCEISITTTIANPKFKVLAFCGGWDGVSTSVEEEEVTADCFSSSTTLHTKDKGIVPITNINVGDAVLTGSGKYDTVYSIDHKHPTKRANFIRIYVDTTAQDDKDYIETTKNHMIFLGNNNPVPAHSIVVGDAVKTMMGPRFVTKILSNVVSNGLYNILTDDGTVVVNNGGVVASTYSALPLFVGDNNKSSEYLIEAFGFKMMTHQFFYNTLLKPYSFVCNAISLELCQMSDNEERVFISEFGATIYDTAMKQNRLYKLMCFSVIISFVCMIHFMNIVTLVGAVAMATGKLWKCKKE